MKAALQAPMESRETDTQRWPHFRIAYASDTADAGEGWRLGQVSWHELHDADGLPALVVRVGHDVVVESRKRSCRVMSPPWLGRPPRIASNFSLSAPSFATTNRAVKSPDDVIPFPFSTQTCVMLHRDLQRLCLFPVIWFVLSFGGIASASLGDRLPEFRECLKDCTDTSCGEKGLSIPLQHRLLLWDCPQECDYVCQHIITEQRLAREPPYLEPVVQFHGKWPFYRFLGMQEPASVLFSLFNFLAHDHGIKQIKENIPARYALRKYYLLFGYFGMMSWIFSMMFHTRDFNVTEKLDYFAAGASVMYGMFYTPIRIFRLDRPDSFNGKTGTVLRLWTLICASAYLMHIGYLTFVRFDYTYNMAANVVVGLVQNVMWTWFSIQRFRKVGRLWAAWPGLIVFWIIFAMSLELFDFPPWWGMVDAHALWHLGTVGPTIWWYNFLVKDAQADLQSARLKQ